MFVKIESAVSMGVKSIPVCVEVDVSRGFPGFDMVGYLGNEVREARQRVQVALKNRGIFMSSLKITVNLAPAHVHKSGTGFDLPIAVGIMTALGCFTEEETKGVLVIGELGLDGKIKPVKGILPAVQAAKERKISCCMVPKANAGEGAAVSGIALAGVETLDEVSKYFKGSEKQRRQMVSRTAEAFPDLSETEEEGPDFSEIDGQENAKRGAQIAAAGFHSMLMIGPPGIGKSMVAKCIPGILPPLTREEGMEVSSVYSIAGLLSENRTFISKRMFLHPHHTVSDQALIGGGRIPAPGMVSLAHHSVLFLDELGEFRRRTLDLLRQPMEEREVRLSRAFGTVTYPANFLLIGAMNPCPCGYYPDQRKCHCSENEIRRYLSKVSGPFLDRIDLCVEMSQPSFSDCKMHKNSFCSQNIKNGVLLARERQISRFKKKRYSFNAQMTAEDVKTFCKLDASGERLLFEAAETLSLSLRGCHSVLKVARTVADLEDCEKIGEAHLLEALSYHMSYEAYRSSK